MQSALQLKLRQMLRRGRGRNLVSVIEELSPIWRGWVGYFRLVEAQGSLEELDAWIRRKLRRILMEAVEAPTHPVQEASPARTG